MKTAGGGAIVNIGTVLVEHALTGVAGFGGHRRARVRFTRSPANWPLNSGPTKPSTLAPGIIRTPIHARNGIEDVDSLAGLHLLGRIGEPDEVADAALMLANNGFISGATLNVDGGQRRYM